MAIKNKTMWPQYTTEYPSTHYKAAVLDTHMQHAIAKQSAKAHLCSYTIRKVWGKPLDKFWKMVLLAKLSFRLRFNIFGLCYSRFFLINWPLRCFMFLTICFSLFSLQFDPAPRRGEPHVTRRTPDYFL